MNRNALADAKEFIALANERPAEYDTKRYSQLQGIVEELKEHLENADAAGIYATAAALDIIGKELTKTANEVYAVQRLAEALEEEINESYNQEVEELRTEVLTTQKENA